MTSNIIPEKLLNLREAAPLFGVSKSNLYGMVARREIPHYRIGGKILLSKDDIAAYLNGRRVEAQESITEPPPVFTHRRQPS